MGALMQLYPAAASLAKLVGSLLRRQDPRIVAQDAQVKVIALLNARKAVLAHRQDELRAQIEGARAAHKATAALRKELEQVTTEILSIG